MAFHESPDVHENDVLVPIVIEGRVSDAERCCDSFEVRPRYVQGTGGQGFARYVGLALAGMLALVAYFSFAARPGTRQTFHGARNAISRAHGELVVRNGLIHSLERQVEGHERELADIARLRSAGHLADEHGLSSVSPDMRERVLTAKESRARDLIAVLRARKDSLTEQNVQLLERIHEAEVQLIQAEQAQDGGAPSHETDARVQVLLGGNGR